jgi:hypothetical protein
LLRFSDGNSREFVPPVSLEAGKYTQLRLVVIDADIVIDGITYPLTISSNDLKTDKNFDFDVVGGGAVTITIDFDLSKSIVVTGPDEYKLKPVLHIVETYAAATIEGHIAPGSFNDPEDAVVKVFLDTDESGGLNEGDEEYTAITVAKMSDVDPTPFRIFWLVPLADYAVAIDFDTTLAGFEFDEFVIGADLGTGVTYNDLNGGNPI